MKVTKLHPTKTAIATLGHQSHSTAWDEPAIEPEVVRSGGDRRKRQDRRTEDEIRRRMDHGLEQLVWDGTPVPPPARVVAAHRLFSEGNGYFSGTLVDRSA